MKYESLFPEDLDGTPIDPWRFMWGWLAVMVALFLIGMFA